MQGGIKVTKPTTGMHLIRDIQVNVPHREEVFIPAEKALNSKDLYRDLATGAIFQLQNTMSAPSESKVQVVPDPKDQQRIRDLEQEVAQLRQSLAQARQPTVDLKTIEKQLQVLVEAVSRLESAPRGASASTLGAPADEIVGVESPMFIPDDLVPTNVDVHLETQRKTAEDAVSGAASRLRQLRKKL